ncbi:family 4 glycosyl hydrolase [Microbacterium gilvum]|uniref:6-phospho-beta-glucosidase n=1 Tax=Microbacterium gilvum TaxID=1336204 RepID=A0ABP8ZWB0_9MICO
MKLTIIGGGGFRVPLIVEAAAAAQRTSPIEEIVLHDVSPARQERILAVIRDMPSAASVRVRAVADLATALRDADFVFVAIRLGGTNGRVRDERIALEAGVLGQETVGAGGLAYAWRTVPATLALAEAIRSAVPRAWVINFTNPAGIVTETMQKVLGDRVVGICDTPIGLIRRALVSAGMPGSKDVDVDYVGLNHLGWLRALRVDGVDLLPGLLASPRLENLEEAHLLGADWIRALRAIPNEYLFYYYRHRQALESARERPLTRGEYLHEQQTRFFDESAGDAWQRWNDVRAKREQTYMTEGRRPGARRRPQDVEAGGYHRVALDLMSALATGASTTAVLNVRNGAVVPSLPSDAVIETACIVAGGRITPSPVAPLTGDMLGLVQQVKASEQLIIEAALGGSKQVAWRAFAAHPLIDSLDIAADLVDRYLDEAPALSRS